MANEGEEMVVIQHSRGHAKSGVTADSYVHRLPNALKQAADRYSGLLDPAGHIQDTVEPADEGVSQEVAHRVAS